jgi:tape measure domain-containing protein
VSVVANVAINVDSSGAVSKLRQVQTQAQQTERAFGGIAAAVGKLAIAFAGIQAIRFVFTQAAELQTQARSLEILAGSAEKAGKIIKELQDLGAVTPFTSTELIDAAKRLQAFGIEADKVVETTRRLADASGATGAELSGLVTAYGQVQAKGRLQGEELLQFQERGIALQEELRKMYGMTGEEFQKALEKGQVSAKAVEVALQRLTDVGGKYANGAIAQSDTLNGKLSTLQDSFQRLAQNIGTFFEPVFKFLLDGINAFLDRVNNGLRVSAQLQANEQAAVRTRNKFGAFRAANPFDQEAQQYEERLRKSLLQSGLSANKGVAPTPPRATPAVPALIGGARAGGGGGGGRAGGGGSSKAANEAKRAADEAARAAEAAAQEAARVQEVIRNRLAEGQIIAVNIQQQDRIAAAEAAGDKMLVARLQSQERELDIQYRYAQELAKEVNLDAQKAIIYEGQNALTANQLDLQRELDVLQTQSDQDRLTSLQKAIEKQYELNTAVQNQLQLADGVANTLGQGLGSAFDALISGAQGWEKSLQQIASGVLIDIANQLIRIFVIEQAINAIKTLLTPFSAATPLGAGGGTVGKFGTLGPNYGIPQRAKGGPVSSGQTYMVGERGPELFVPGRSGTIVANDKMGGGNTNVVVNVDAKGSSVEGDEQGANQLGRVISAAVQSELIKQQRPGGILAR